MIYSGLVSVSFRKLTPEEIIELVKRANLDGIEWGGDVHVPHADLETAEKVRKMTKNAGITIAAYGSYYRAGISENEGLKFEDVLKTAKVLQAPTIRVWAGNLGSEKADKDYREKVITDLKRISLLADKEGISISLEHHNNTLTDTNESCYKLMNELADSSIMQYWQPPLGQSNYLNIEDLNALLSKLTNVHVFFWEYKDGKIDQRALSEGKHEWLKYLHLVKKSESDHFAMLEFVKGDSPEQFMKDAETLTSILQEVNS
jgi:3-dehydroshikimate dehydratase